MGKMGRIRESIDGAATVGRVPNVRSVLPSTSQTVPLSSIRDAPPNCKRFAEIFCGNRNRKRAEAKTNGEREPRRPVALNVDVDAVNERRGKIFDFFRFWGAAGTQDVLR